MILVRSCHHFHDGDPVDLVAFRPAAKFFIELVRLLNRSNTSFLDKSVCFCAGVENEGLEEELKQLLFICNETPFEIDDFLRFSFSDLFICCFEEPDGGNKVVCGWLLLLLQLADVIEVVKFAVDFFKSLFDFNFSRLFESSDLIRLNDDVDDVDDTLLVSLFWFKLLLLLRLAGTTLVTIAISFWSLITVVKIHYLLHLYY